MAFIKRSGRPLVWSNLLRFGLVVGFLGFALLLLLVPPWDHRHLYSTYSSLLSVELELARLRSSFPISMFERYQYRPAAYPHSTTDQQVASELCGSYPNFERWYKLGPDQRSDHDEDRIIFERFFKLLVTEDASPFVYVEVGAFDGLAGSNSRFFDVCLGWEGLVVEANPMIYPKLNINRLNSHRMNFAASCNDTDDSSTNTVPFAKVKWPNAAQLVGVDTPYQKQPHVRLADVPCGSLTPVLTNLFHGKPITFFSLDVSGAEHLVVQNLDFSTVQVDILIVQYYQEYCKENCESRRVTQAVMHQWGYHRIPGVLKRYDVYVLPESQFMFASN